MRRISRHIKELHHGTRRTEQLSYHHPTMQFQRNAMSVSAYAACPRLLHRRFSTHPSSATARQRQTSARVTLTCSKPSRDGADAPLHTRQVTQCDRSTSQLRSTWPSIRPSKQVSPIKQPSLRRELPWSPLEELHQIRHNSASCKSHSSCHKTTAFRASITAFFSIPPIRRTSVN